MCCSRVRFSLSNEFFPRATATSTPLPAKPLVSFYLFFVISRGQKYKLSVGSQCSVAKKLAKRPDGSGLGTTVSYRGNGVPQAGNRSFPGRKFAFPWQGTRVSSARKLLHAGYQQLITTRTVSRNCHKKAFRKQAVYRTPGRTGVVRFLPPVQPFPKQELRTHGAPAPRCCFC